MILRYYESMTLSQHQEPKRSHLLNTIFLFFISTFGLEPQTLKIKSNNLDAINLIFINVTLVN